MSDGGKGHAPRPFSVSQEEFDASHERIFGPRPKKPRYVPPPLPQMEGAQRALQDVIQYGTGAYRQHTDGSTEYVDLHKDRKDGAQCSTQQHRST